MFLLSWKNVLSESRKKTVRPNYTEQAVTTCFHITTFFIKYQKTKQKRDRRCVETKKAYRLSF